MNKKKLIKIIFLIFAIAFISIIFSIANMGYTKIHKNISISGINVAHKEKNDAEEEIKKLYREKQIQGLILKHNDFEIVILLLIIMLLFLLILLKETLILILI